MTATLLQLSLAALLNRRRTLLLGVLAVLVVLIAALYRLSDPAPAEAARFTGRLLADFGLAAVLPLVAVIVGTAALGSELEDGTIVHLLAKPVPRWRIVAAKLLVAWLVVTVIVAIPIAVAGVVGQAGELELGAAYAAASVVGALEYTAVFVALSIVTSRALVVGLAYVVVWEGVVSGLFAGTRVLSVRQHALAVADALGGEGAVAAELDPTTAVTMALLVVVAAAALAVRRLGRVELRGETA